MPSICTALTGSTPVTLADVQRQLLDGDTLLLEFALGYRRKGGFRGMPRYPANHEAVADELATLKALVAEAEMVYDRVKDKPKIPSLPKRMRLK